MSLDFHILHVLHVNKQKFWYWYEYKKCLKTVVYKIPVEKNLF